MIVGIGCDIAKVSRFAKWVENDDMIHRFFADCERVSPCTHLQRKCEFYASRFAAKEAFSKALGTGLVGFELKDVYIETGESGKPEMKVTGNAENVLKRCCGDSCRIHVSLSHEKEYAMAFVVIEQNKKYKLGG